MKRMLRDKANYVVLEGLLTTLFKEREGNQERPRRNDKKYSHKS